MENIRAIRTRMRSIESTQKITRSMKLVSASKLRKTQSASLALSAYAEKIRILLEKLLSDRRCDSPYFEQRSGSKVLYVLFVGSRGLCGTYNLSILKYLQEQIGENSEATVALVGRWGKDLIAATDLVVVRSFDEIGDTPSAEDAAVLVDYLKSVFLSGEADRVELVFQRFDSVLSQSPGTVTLFPIERRSGEADRGGFIFEPDKKSVFASLVELTIQNTVYSALLEARTGEHASRMTAMTAAGDNTDELLNELELRLNHARQSAITTEISEIVGGAAALNG